MPANKNVGILGPSTKFCSERRNFAESCYFFFLFLKIMYVTYNLFLGCVWMEGLEGRKRMVYFSFLNYSHYEMFYNKGEGLIYFKKHVL